MSIFASVRSKLSAIVDSLSKQIKAVAAAFLPKAEALVEVGVEDVLNIAAQAVLAEAPKVLSGQDKFQSAVQSVIKTVTSQGKTIAVNTAGAAVQLAFLEIQNSLTPKAK